MNKLYSPCMKCRTNESDPKCHSHCLKYNAFAKINREVNRHINNDIRNSKRAYCKPAVHAIYAKTRN